jgi:hypothetical protein
MALKPSDFRSLPPSASGAPTLSSAVRSVPDSWQPEAPPSTLGQEFGRGVARGVDDSQGLLWGLTAFVGDTVGSNVLSAAGRRGYEENKREAAFNPPEVGSIGEINDTGDFFKWGAAKLGEATPLVVGAFTQSSLGMMTARRLFEQGLRRATFAEAQSSMAQMGVKEVGSEAAAAATRKMMADPMVQQQLRRAISMRVGRQMFTSSSALGTGEAQGELMEAGVNAPGAALAAGLTMGALDTLPGMMFVSKFFPGVEPKLAKSYVLGVLKETGKGLPAEGVTEGLQEATLLAARAFADPSFDIGDPANKDRILEAAAAGALVGAVMGGASTAVTDAGPRAARRGMEEWAAAKERKSGFLGQLRQKATAFSETARRAAEQLRVRPITPEAAAAAAAPDPGEAVRTDLSNYLMAALSAAKNGPIAEAERIARTADELFNGVLPEKDIRDIVTATENMSAAIDLELFEPATAFVEAMKVELEAAISEAMGLPAAEQQARLDEINKTFRARVDQFRQETVSPLIKKYSDQLAKYLDTAPLSDPTVKDMGPDDFEEVYTYDRFGRRTGTARRAPSKPRAGVEPDDGRTWAQREQEDLARILKMMGGDSEMSAPGTAPDPAGMPLTDADTREQLTRQRFGMSPVDVLKTAGRRVKNRTEQAKERIEGEKRTIVDKFSRDGKTSQAIPFATRKQARAALAKLREVFPDLRASAFDIQEEGGKFYVAILDAMQDEATSARLRLYDGFESARLSARDFENPAEIIRVRWPGREKFSRLDAKQFAEAGARIYEAEGGVFQTEDPAERAVIGFETAVARMLETGKPATKSEPAKPAIRGSGKDGAPTAADLDAVVIRVDRNKKPYTYGELRKETMEARDRSRDGQPLGFDEEQSEEDKASDFRGEPGSGGVLGTRSDAPKKGEGLKAQNEFYGKLYEKQKRAAKKKIGERDTTPVFDRGADPFFTPSAPQPTETRTSQAQANFESAQPLQPDRFLDNVRNPNLDSRTIDGQQAIDMPGSEFAGGKNTEADRNRESIEAPSQNQPGVRRGQRDQVAYVRLDSVSEQTQKDVIELVEVFRETLGLKDRVEIFDAESIRNSAMFDDHPFGELLKQAAADPSVTARVFMHPIHGITIYLSNKMVSENQAGVSPEVARQRAYRAIAHELGHAVFEIYFNKLTPALQARLRAAAPQGSQTGGRFEEWAADQLVSWAIDRNRKTRNAVDSFFKRVVDKLYDFYQRVRAKYKLNDTFAEFLDGVAQYVSLGAERRYTNEYAAAFAELNVLGTLRNTANQTGETTTKDLGDLVAVSPDSTMSVSETIAAHAAAGIVPALEIRMNSGQSLYFFDERSGDRTKLGDAVTKFGKMIAELADIGGVSDAPIVVSLTDGAKSARGPMSKTGTEYGAVLVLNDGIYITLPKNLLEIDEFGGPGGRAAMVVGHELGHVVFRKYFSSAPLAVRAALVRDALADIYSGKAGVTVPSRFRIFGPTFEAYRDELDAAAARDGIDPKTQSPVEALGRSDAYFGALVRVVEEWAATQFISTVASEGSKAPAATPETEKFFASLGSVMRKIYDALARFFRPSEAYGEFLRSALMGQKRPPGTVDSNSRGKLAITQAFIELVANQKADVPGAPQWLIEGARESAPALLELAQQIATTVRLSQLRGGAPRPRKGQKGYDAKVRQRYAERTLRRIKRKLDASPTIAYGEKLGMDLFDQTFATVAGQLRRIPGGDKLADIFFRIRGQISGNDKPTFYNRMQRFRSELIADGIKIFKDVPEAEINAAFEELWKLTTGRQAPAQVSPLAQKILDFYQAAYGKGRKSGLPLIFRRNYIPLMWGEKQKLLDDRTKIVAHLAANYITPSSPTAQLTAAERTEAAEKLFDSLVSGAPEQINFNPGVNDKIDTPSGRFFNKRHKMLSDAFFKPYIEQNPRVSMIRYIHALSNAAVFNEYFGEEAIRNSPEERQQTGEVYKNWNPRAKLMSMLNDMGQAGATAAQIRRTKDLVDAALGRYGRDFPPNVRTAMGWVLTYQNMRTLLFGTLSSFPDIIGPAIRANNMQLAWKSLKAGIKDVANRNSDFNQLARIYGIYTDEFQNHILSYDYDNHWFSPMARNINDKMFTAIQLHRWTNFTRSVGMRVGLDFIAERAAKAVQGDPVAIHDLQQLNLSVEEATAWLQGGRQLPGESTYSQADPAIAAADNKVVDALIQFVNESVMRPDPSQRPLWASHPAAMLIFHLHQFMYLFQNTIMGQMFANAKAAGLGWQGAMKLAGPAMMMMLMTAIGLELRELFQYRLWGAKTPTDDQDALAYLGNLAQRTGFLGIGQYAMDFFEASERGNNGFIGLLGPTVEQVNGWVADPASTSLVRAVPILNQLPPARRAVGATLAGG